MGGIEEPVSAHKEHLSAFLEPLFSREPVTECTFPAWKTLCDSNQSLCSLKIGAGNRLRSLLWKSARVVVNNSVTGDDPIRSKTGFFAGKSP